MRLVSRLVDLLHLAAPGGEQWLDAGAAATGPRQGQAWVETARGLLVYRVTLADDGTTIAGADAVAPTDWNFHPQGVLAQALAGVHDTAEARCLAAAFDPCVPFDVLPAPAAAPRPEPAHA